MLYLGLSIVFSSFLTLSFKQVERMGLSNLQVITWNYLTCVVVGLLIRGSVETDQEVLFGPLGRWALLTGLIFIVSFNLIAYTVQKLGIAIASVSSKLSLVIPFLMSVLLYGEEVHFWKLTGVMIALLAVYLTCLPSGGLTAKDNRSGRSLSWVLPIVLFFLTGFLDTIIKYVETTQLTQGYRDDYLIYSFATAFAGGLIILVFRYIKYKESLAFRNVVAGICIGVPNYASIWCLIEVLKTNKGNSTFALPVNNIGILLFSTFMAWLLFKERISFLNWVGIILSLAAILLITYG